MKQRKNPATRIRPADYMSVSACAELVGVTTTRVYQRVQADELRHLTMGEGGSMRIFILRADAEEWAAKHATQRQFGPAAGFQKKRESVLAGMRTRQQRGAGMVVPEAK